MEDFTAIFLNAFLDAITVVSAKLQILAIAQVPDTTELLALLQSVTLHAYTEEFAVV